jgi:hypothetical protein
MLNGNSGGAAISVAAQMGAKKIYLLGFDMKLDEKENQHWHNIYRFNPNKKETQMPFDKHLMGFPKIAEDAKRLGIKIINVNPESAIDVFPKVSLREILKVNEVLI